MDQYHHSEYSRTLAIGTQFGLVGEKLEEQDKRIKEQDNRIESNQTEAKEQFNTNILKSKQNRDRIETLENKLEEIERILRKLKSLP